MSSQYGELRPTSGSYQFGSVTAPHFTSGCQPYFAALNRGRHLCLAGWPSRWALAHILVNFILPWSSCVALKCLLCADVLWRNCSLTHYYRPDGVPVSRWTVSIALQMWLQNLVAKLELWNYFTLGLLTSSTLQFWKWQAIVVIFQYCGTLCIYPLPTLYCTVIIADVEMAVYVFVLWLRFLGTICKTVCPMLSVRCLSVCL